MSNSGYKINTYKDINPYSNSYGNVKTERIYDEITCPIGHIHIDYIVQIDNSTLNDTKAINKGDYSIIVDWGDGNIESIGKDVRIIGHTYQASGEYNIVITSDDAADYFVGISKYATKINSYELTLGNNIVAPQFMNLFADVPANKIETINPVWDVNGDWQINNSTIPFNSVSIKRIETFPDMFYCTNLNSPILYNQSTVEYITEDLLKNYTGSKLNLFQNCSNLEVNINTIFNYISNPSAITDVKNMFAFCPKLTGEALPIISALTSVTSSNASGAFKNCTSLSDYNSIPANWK